MKNKRFTFLFMLAATTGIILLSACGLLESSGTSTPALEEVIGEAVRDYLAQQGGSADQVEVEVEQLEGDFARAKIISTDPAVPGGFTGFLRQEDGVWRTLVVGSGFDPLEIQSLGIPESILPEGWVFPSDEQPASAVCPTATEGALLLVDETRGYCLLYPASHTVVQLDSGNTEIVVGELMNHIDPRVSIYTEELAGRSMEQVIDDFIAGYEGFEIEQTRLAVAGEEAILLSSIPGQDYYRKVLVIHDGLLYHLNFEPYDENLVDTFPQAESLYALVMGSFQFSTQ